MSTFTYQQMIMNDIRGLPLDILAEIADFVAFKRQKHFQPQTFESYYQLFDTISEQEEAHFLAELDEFGFDAPIE